MNHTASWLAMGYPQPPMASFCPSAQRGPARTSRAGR